MHEFAVTQQVVEIALETARARQAPQITGVRVRVGSLTGIVEEAMRFYFDALLAGTPAEGASLQVEVEPARATCRACGWQGAAEPPLDPACPICGQCALAVEGGRDLVVVSVELVEEPVADGAMPRAAAMPG
jgi:hydrogenase nickel incorporation protein HypA/HybF